MVRLELVRHDGGKQAEEVKCPVPDCAIRAVAIALELPFSYSMGFHAGIKGKSPREINRLFVGQAMHFCGWEWFPSDARMNKDELPSGRILVRTIEHYVCIEDGIMWDTYDSTRQGKRQIHEYWRKNEQTNRSNDT